MIVGPYQTFVLPVLLYIQSLAPYNGGKKKKNPQNGSENTC